MFKTTIKMVLCCLTFALFLGIGSASVRAAITIDESTNLEDVFDGAVISGSTVKLTKDVSFETVLNVNTDITIDTNGKNIVSTGKDGKGCIVVGANKRVNITNNSETTSEIALDSMTNGFCVEGKLSIYKNIVLNSTASTNAVYCDRDSEVSLESISVKGGKTAVNAAGDQCVVSISNADIGESTRTSATIGLINITGSNSSVLIDNSFISASYHRYNIYQNASGSILTMTTNTVTNGVSEDGSSNGIYVAMGVAQIFDTNVTNIKGYGISVVGEGTGNFYDVSSTSLESAGLCAASTVAIYGGEYVGGVTGMECQQNSKTAIYEGNFIGTKYGPTEPAGSIVWLKDDTMLELFGAKMFDLDQVETAMSDGFVPNMASFEISLDDAVEESIFKTLKTKRVAVVSDIKSVSLEKDEYEYTGSKIEPEVRIKTNYGSCDEYDVKYPSATAPGDYKVTVTFNGMHSYVNKVELPFTIKGDTPGETTTNTPGETTTNTTTEVTTTQESTTVTPATTKPNVLPTGRTDDIHFLPLGNTSIKKAKAKGKKLSLTLAKAKNASGYYVYVFKNKKDAKKKKKCLIKKKVYSTKVVIKSSKFKKYKKLYIIAVAYERISVAEKLSKFTKVKVVKRK